MFGGFFTDLAAKNGWAGLLVYGCIRDVEEIARVPIGIKALNTHPARSNKEGGGERDVAVTFAGVTFQPGQYLYADADGVVVADRSLVS